uniref:hypothetical protein n=1 Tax=Cupriavidus gilardii TaxID=82541 RepID=UPI00247A55F9|nr:hypothetical protein [Cupriavidus gilardii]WDE72694.1 hypothetical protein [Cupriavidus gilardii]
MPTYRDFKKGDARRDMLVLRTLAVKRTVPATAIELEISKSECTAAIGRLPQFGVELEKDGAEWTIKSWGVLNQRAVTKLLDDYKPGAASPPPRSKAVAAKNPTSAKKAPVAAKGARKGSSAT